ncbi:hypothetical protein PSPO01_03445 [Paraphaeosphaeria sporulosa]
MVRRSSARAGSGRASSVEFAQILQGTLCLSGPLAQHDDLSNDHTARHHQRRDCRAAFCPASVLLADSRDVSAYGNYLPQENVVVTASVPREMFFCPRRILVLAQLATTAVQQQRKFATTAASEGRAAAWCETSKRSPRRTYFGSSRLAHRAA